MARIPVVGTKQVHTVQLSPKLRQVLHERAARQNHREYAPVIAADKRAIGLPQHEYETHVGAAKGATSAIEASLAQALAGLQGSGLHGRTLQQAIQGLSSRQGEAVQALPYAYAGAAEERNKAQREARQGLLEDRAKLQSGIATDFDNLLESNRSSGAQSLKEQEGRERDHRQEVAENERQHEKEVKENHREHQKKSSEALYTSQGGLRNAYDVALTAYKHLLGHAGEETKKGAEIKPPKSVTDWEAFAEEVSHHADGADQEDALHAVELLRHQLSKLRHQGKLPDAGAEAEEG